MASRGSLSLKLVEPQRSSTPRSAPSAEEAPVIYDPNEFVCPDERALQDLKCQVCRRVPREPRVTQCCRQTFCLPCLTTGGGVANGDVRGGAKRSLKQCCPYCNEQDNFWYSVNPTSQRILESLLVYCRSEGCQWSGTLRERQNDHSNECEYALVPCPKLCVTPVARKDLPLHLEKNCRYREYQCKHCNERGPYAEIMGLDPIVPRHICPKLRISCPNRCRGSKIFLRREELPMHLRSCPQEKLDCQFKSVGCDVKLVRKDYENHMRIALQNHLCLLLSSFQTKTKALRDEMNLLTQNVRDPSTLCFLGCMNSHMQLGKLVLSGVGDAVTFRVPNFSQLQQCSNDEGQWHSPPFYFLTGYKLELVVCPGGSGTGVGTHLSVHLLLHKPEEGSHVEWPLDCVGRGVWVSLMKQSDTPTASAREASQMSTSTSICSLCSKDTLAIPQDEDPPTLEMIADDKFFPLENLVDSGLQLHNSVVIRVEMTLCKCITAEAET